MAKQPFEPSDFPEGERQLNLAYNHVKDRYNEYGTHLADHVGSQLVSLADTLEEALDAETIDSRIKAIEEAYETVETLKRDNAFNFTFSAALERMVGNRLDYAVEELTEDD